MSNNIVEKDSFLNVNFFNKIKKEINGYFHFIKETRDPSKILNKISQKLQYVKSFGLKGVQGITGILHCKSLKDLPIVFKISVEIDRAIEHENSVIQSLNTLRPFCPHFVGSLGMYNLPISRTFVYTYSEDDSLYEDFEDSENESGSEDLGSSTESENSESEEEYELEDVELFMDDHEFLPTNMLLIEYVSNITFEHLCRKNCVENRTLILSQILMIISALQISQKHLNFTHYDLHVENILIRQCEPEAIFVYNINDNLYTVPTFGFYPVIIDMGSSYSVSVENNSMKTSVAHYNNGLQPTIYDPLNDLHHFLLSALNSIEYESNEFYFLSTRMMYFFRNIPILRKRGWKQLPNNIMKLTILKIDEVCSSLQLNYRARDSANTNNGTKIKKVVDITNSQKVEEGIKNSRPAETKKEKKDKNNGLYCFPVWSDMNRDIIEILSLGVKVPWNLTIDEELASEFDINEGTEDFEDKLNNAIRKCFPDFLTEFQKFDDLKKFEDGNDLLYMLRELVELVYCNWNNISRKIPKHVSKNLLNTYKNTVIKEFKDMPASLNWDSILINCKYIISILNHLFYKYVSPHVELINNSYLKGEIRNPLDLFNWFKQNTAIRTVYSNNTVLYIWDSDNKTSNKIMLKDIINNEMIEKLNNMTPLNAEKQLKTFLK
jgi:hypothetical protein